MPTNPMEVFNTIWPLLLIFVVFYFVLIRPQKKREKQTKDMLDAMRVGDEVLTIGGIYGKVVRIKEDTVFIESSTDKTKMQVARWGIKDILKYAEDKGDKKAITSETIEEATQENE